MSGWLPPGCTDEDIDRACPGYYDEPEAEEYDWEDDARKGYALGIAMMRWRLAIVRLLWTRSGR